VDQGHFGEATLLLGLFLGQNVAFERMLTLDLTGAGKLKTLFGTRVSLNFWHFLDCFYYSQTVHFLVKGCKDSRKKLLFQYGTKKITAFFGL